jgi:hypothetical protein
MFGEGLGLFYYFCIVRWQWIIYKLIGIQISQIKSKSNMRDITLLYSRVQVFQTKLNSLTRCLGGDAMHKTDAGKVFGRRILAVKGMSVCPCCKGASSLPGPSV